jgi:hypothetical protein
MANIAAAFAALSALEVFTRRAETDRTTETADDTATPAIAAEREAVPETAADADPAREKGVRKPRHLARRPEGARRWMSVPHKLRHVRG